MKRLFIFAVALLLFVSAAQAGEKKVLLIMLDGQRADAMFTAPTPNFDALRNGTWAEGYKGAYTFQSHTNLESAPSSATNHVAIATGVTAKKNEVYKNGQTFKGKYDVYPTWMQRLRKADPNIVSVWLYNWGEDGYIPADATYQNSRGGGVDGDVKIHARRQGYKMDKRSRRRRDYALSGFHGYVRTSLWVLRQQGRIL